MKSSRPVVGPLQVLEHQHDGSVLGQPLEEQRASPRTAPRGTGRLGHAEQHAEPRREELALGRIRRPIAPGPRASFAAPPRRRRVLGDAQPLANHLGERPVGDPLAVGEAAAGVPQDGLGEPVQVLEELPRSRDLPTPASPLIATRRAERRLDAPWKSSLSRRRSRVAADQRRLQPRSRSGPPAPATHLDRPPQVQRLGLAFDRVLTGVLVGDRERGHLAGDVVDEHRPRAPPPTGSARLC